MPYQQNLVAAAQNYINYLNKIGTEEAKDTIKIPHPFNDDCQKIMNGELVAKSAAELVKQLSDARKSCESWEIDVLEIIPSTETKSATLYYNIKAQPVGAFAVIKVARFGDLDKVREVIEVFTPLK